MFSIYFNYFIETGIKIYSNGYPRSKARKSRSVSIITTEVKSRYRLLVSGRIDYVFVYKNMTLKNELKRNIFIPLGIKTARKNQEYTATYCGDVMISYDKVYLYDVFGFCRVPISQTQKHHLWFIQER